MSTEDQVASIRAEDRAIVDEVRARRRNLVVSGTASEEDVTAVREEYAAVVKAREAQADAAREAGRVAANEEARFVALSHQMEELEYYLTTLMRIVARSQ